MSDFFEAGDEGIILDLDAIEAATSELIPAGIYNAVIEELEYKLSASSQQPMWAMVVTIIDEEYAGRKLYDNLSFSPKALPITKKTLLNLCPEKVTSTFSPKNIAAEGDLIGLNVQIKTAITKDKDGEKRTKIKNIVRSNNDSGFLG